MNDSLCGGLRLRGIAPKRADDQPLVSIITAVYNGAAHVEECIQSVLSQQYPNIEYIVVDGGSTDGTVDIIKRYDDRIDYWVSARDKGIYDAWNKGLALATGEWIGYLSADDAYVPDAVAGYVELIGSEREVGRDVEYVSSKILYKDGDNARLMGQAWSWPTFQRYMNVVHVGSLHSRAFFDRYGVFDPNYRICGDYELLLRPRGKLKAAFRDFVTVHMRAGGVSNSSTRALDEAFKAKRETGGRNALLCAFERIVAIAKYRARARGWFA